MTFVATGETGDVLTTGTVIPGIEIMPSITGVVENSTRYRRDIVVLTSTVVPMFTVREFILEANPATEALLKKVEGTADRDRKWSQVKAIEGEAQVARARK